ncbi:hypothetical protein Kpol_529p14 [Vanderwaltozyma polyspora DSM 70294]|uniref:Activator of Hsp90 ATPase AHSA1-like N-terminal domain-containing protein n=1 Tax=Vanderwaltozyma polyspora (strain ATCC 22028 / DSM 70294 / BCRC 21397 / CBS 2163 / NBRC 10782 / NRRL Y-8283 / UCD 57-17) TaxID=436907 RepID=A7TM67_VANPO|nr:uncharacterized protein Kpol_529p14 [Vanderwaltozyma polyspora DSM 70294]EDO16634.1 hypothetical protein Kpol_529p14 [Vanderwaltozyma polyspora DSM 70294]
MVVNNPNNWHWVDKNCIDWAKKYLHEKLTGVSTDSGEETYAIVDKVSSIEGDCEVNQRKGKVISLFDLEIVMAMKGQVEGNGFEGSISVPEVAFDSEIDDYQFEISVYKETTKLNEIKPIIREKLLPKFREIFQQFGKDLLIANGNDIQISQEKVTSTFTKSNQKQSLGEFNKNASTTATSGNTTVKTSTQTDASSSSKKTSAIKIGTGNTTTIHLEPTFNAPAEELYKTFLDKERIIAWSKGGVKSDGKERLLQKDEEFEIFGGNIISKLVEEVPNKILKFEWRLLSWNKGNNSTIRMEFHESKEFHETKIQVDWSGIPIGEEDRARANFEDYYVRSIKLTFGFGAVL